MDRIYFCKRTAGFSRLLLCLAAVLVLAAGWAGGGRAEGENRILNASGNRNIEPAVDPIRKNEGFSAILYDNRNGLPTSEANAVAQTGEGFIWIGSYAGLIRYDGTTFERIDASTGISNVRCLFVDSLDRLWVGTNDSGVFCIRNGAIRKWSKEEGLRTDSIRAVAEDESGAIYVAGTGGVALIDTELNLSLLEDERVGSRTVRDVRLGADGLVYGLTSGGDLFAMKDGEIHSYLSSEECRAEGILAILPDPEKPGFLYLGTEESKIYYGRMEGNFPVLGVKSIGSLTNAERMEYIQGKLWICAENGIGRLENDGYHSLKNVPVNNSVSHVMTDYEGNLWFTSARQGVMKIVPNQFTDLFERYDLQGEVVNSTCLLGNRLYIGTDTGLIVTQNEKRLEELPLSKAVTASGKEVGATDLLEYLDGVRIRSVNRDSQGRIWISTWRKYGLICYDRGEMTVFSEEDGLFSDLVRTSIELSDGSILVSNRGGVSIIREGRVAAGYGKADGMEVTDFLTVAEGDNGELLLGSDGGGIYIVSPKEIRNIGIEDGLNSEVILRIRRSRTQDVFWIVTSNSLAYMTPDYRVTTIRQFPYPNNYDIFENSKGDVWVIASNGIYVVSAEELLANGAVEPLFCGIRSGLPYTSTANSFSEAAENGDLYIASSLGVVKVNIEEPLRNLSEMKMALPFVNADGQLYYPDDEGSITVPGRARKLTVYPFVFNYSLNDPQVTYRLEGSDLAETTVNRSELGPVDYTNLRIGAYHFHLTVKDPVRHSEQTVTFRIVKGKEMNAETVGTIVMISASLCALIGIILYTSPFRKNFHRRVSGMLFVGLLLSDITTAAGELLSLILEYINIPLVRVLMILGNTVYYIALVSFPYLLLLYLEYFIRPDRFLLRKKKLLYGIPCFLFTAAVIVNLFTGWLFTIGEENNYISGLSGILVYLPTIPVWFYLLLSLGRMYRIRKKLAAAGLLMIAVRAIGDFCFPAVSSTTFLYTLLLIWIQLYFINRPAAEEV